jgi:hypothetical protein
MARSVDVARRLLWEDRLRRFDDLDVTVTAFCEAEGVSAPSFYQWRKRLGANRDRAANGRHRPQHLAVLRRSRGQTFVPLHLVQHAATVEIHLPNGGRVALHAGELAALEAVVAVVGRLRPATDGEVESC